MLLATEYYVATNVLPYSIIKPYRAPALITPQDFDLNAQEVAIDVEDSLQLKGYWVKTDQEEKGVIVMVHGIGGNKEAFIPICRTLSRQGYSSLIFDGRSHGESDGEYCTYGFYEKSDISKIVDYIKNENMSAKIGIWGNSLGGAIALQALEMDKRIEFGVIESTFTDLNQIVHDYQKRHTKGIGFKQITNIALKHAGEIAKFNPEMVRPVESVTHIEQPLLIAHGDADKNISVNYGKELYAKAASKDKELVIVKGGGHQNLSGAGGPEYMQRLMRFIKEHTK